MAKQLRLDLGKYNAQQFAPVKQIQQAARDYTASQGRRYRAPSPQLQQTPRVGFAIQQEYRRRQQQPQSRTIARSYKALARETEDQYDFMTRPREQGGLGIKHTVTEGDPYQSPHEMAADVRQGRTKTFATASTGGHAFFSDEQNDKFRAIHDVFGHAAIGRGFSRHGEEGAWRSHVQMFSPQAREAMTSETRGQNSYLNYSPQGGFPDQTKQLIGMSRLAQSPRANVLLEERPRRIPSPGSTQPGLFG